jgi:hypothetical protein
MTILPDKVDTQQVVDRYKLEHRGPEGREESIRCLEKLSKEHEGNWVKVLISRKDTLGVRLPEHKHDASVNLCENGIPVSVAAKRFKQAVLSNEPAECLDRIRSQEKRDFSRTCLFLQFQDNTLRHVDGLHRLLAYAIYGHTVQIPAFVVGLQHGQTASSARNERTPKLVDGRVRSSSCEIPAGFPSSNSTPI